MIQSAILVLNHLGATLLRIGEYLGIGVLITGIIFIGLGIAERKVNQHWGWKTVEGVIDLVLGFIIIANPYPPVILIPFIIGFWASSCGIFLIINASSGKWVMGLKLQSRRMLIPVLAIVLMFHPVWSIKTLYCLSPTSGFLSSVKYNIVIETLFNNKIV